MLWFDSQLCCQHFVCPPLPSAFQHSILHIHVFTCISKYSYTKDQILNYFKPKENPQCPYQALLCIMQIYTTYTDVQRCTGTMYMLDLEIWTTVKYCTWVIFDSPLNNLSDVLERRCILPHIVVAQCYAVAGISPVALHLEHCVEVGARFTVALLLWGTVHIAIAPAIKINIMDIDSILYLEEHTAHVVLCVWVISGTLLN